MCRVYLCEDMGKCINLLVKDKRNKLIFTYGDERKQLARIDESLDNITQFSILQRYFIGDLDDKQKSLENKINLTEILDKLECNIYNDNKDSIQLLKNNKVDCANTIKLITETNMDIDLLYKNSGKLEETFKSVYYDMSITDNYYFYIDKTTKLMNSKEEFDNLLDSFSKEIFKDELLYEEDINNEKRCKNRFIFISLDVVTPPQLFLIKLLEKHGYEVLFIAKSKCQTKEEIEEGKISVANKVFYETYKGEDIKYIYPLDRENGGDVLLEILKGNKEKAREIYNNDSCCKIRVCVTSNIVKYSKYIYEATKNNQRVNSCNKKADESLQRNIIGFGVKQIYEFSDNAFGRFLLAIYGTYNPDGDIRNPDTLIKFNKEALRKCFSYEKLIITVNNQEIYIKDYYSTFERLGVISEQLNDATADKWIDAIDRMINNKDSLRMDLLRVGAFQISKKELTIIKKIFELIRDLAKELFIIENDLGDSVENHTLIEYLEKINSITSSNSAMQIEEDDILEIQLLQKEVVRTIKKFGGSKIIRRAKLKNEQLIDQINEFLMSLEIENEDGDGNLQKNKPREILSFSNCNILDERECESPRIICSFDINNIVQDSNYTEPLDKEMVKGYIDNIPSEGENADILKALPEASLNILNSSDLQFIHALYIHLSYKGEIIFLRYKEPGENNMSYIEKLLCDTLEIKVENLDDDSIGIGEAYSIPFDLEEFKNKEAARNILYSLNKNISLNDFCPRRIIYNFFKREEINELSVLIANGPKVICKAFKDLPYVKKRLSEVVLTMYPGKSNTFRKDTRSVAITQMDKKTDGKAVGNDEKTQEKILKDIIDNLDDPNILFSATTNAKICKRCSARCPEKYSNIKRYGNR